MILLRVMMSKGRQANQKIRGFSSLTQGYSTGLNSGLHCLKDGFFSANPNCLRPEPYKACRAKQTIIVTKSRPCSPKETAGSVARSCARVWACLARIRAAPSHSVAVTGRELRSSPTRVQLFRDLVPQAVQTVSLLLRVLCELRLPRAGFSEVQDLTQCNVGWPRVWICSVQVLGRDFQFVFGVLVQDGKHMNERSVRTSCFFRGRH